MDEATFLARFRRPIEHKTRHPGRYAAPPAGKPTADLATFATMVQAVGGTMHAQVARDALAEAVSSVIEFGQHGRCVATARALALLGHIPENVETAAEKLAIAGADSPRQWADVDLAIIRVDLAVAENAAMLVTAAELPGRALAFLAQHVLALVDIDTIVADLHDGYDRLCAAPLPHHALWISGPSKTADIEQTLVVGAHGCRSLVVVPYSSGKKAIQP